MDQVEAHLSFSEIRSAAHDLAQRRRELIAERLRHAQNAVRADEAYRVKRGREVAKNRAAGKAQEESIILAESEAAGEKAERDMEQVLEKDAVFRIEATEREQSTLRQLGDWSQSLETVG